MSDDRDDVTLSVSLPAATVDYLQALCGDICGPTVEDVLQHLAEHAADGVRRPGSWEREWLIQCASDEFTANLRPHPEAPFMRAPPEKSMARLVRSFPTLKAAEGVAPWDVDKFLTWALLDHRGGAGAAHAVRFILSVQRPVTDWPGYVLGECNEVVRKLAIELRRREAATLTKQYGETYPNYQPSSQAVAEGLRRKLTEQIGPFNAVAACQAWDATHRAAFRAWAVDGWLAERIEERPAL